MKKYFYYIIWFIEVPAIIAICVLLDITNLINMSIYPPLALLILSCIIAGIFSPTHKTFDFLITIIMPLSLFIMMFIHGFLTTSDLETRFHFYIAIDTAFNSWLLITYFVMALITFLASYKAIRITRILKKH